ncbi:unnamed protein product [Paramecium octaurelia]|uniref:Uncharacterized protein n=1 Tax=Paramecium octaurelia TaxID=43137 RepID=A0A8S1U4Z3_PAROT|nr:unnamed protein product [Paramecium octaurelia]
MRVTLIFLDNQIQEFSGFYWKRDTLIILIEKYQFQADSDQKRINLKIEVTELGKEKEFCWFFNQSLRLQ